MSGLPTVGFELAVKAAIIIWKAGLIPNIVGQPGGGKTAVANFLAARFKKSEFTQMTKDNIKGALIRLNLGCLGPEDVVGLFDPAALQGESPVTRQVPPEWLVYASQYQSIILADEIDRTRPSVMNAIIGGLAENPPQFGGVSIGKSKIISTMNGETDGGCIELPEAMRQRMVHLYYVPNQLDWLCYMKDSHPEFGGAFIDKLSAQNEKMAESWTPYDMAGDSQRFERNADRLLSLMTAFSATVKGGKLVDEEEQDDLMDVLGVGQVGLTYWNDIRPLFKATAWLNRWGITSSEVISDPTNATLPPAGLSVKAYGFISVVEGISAEAIPSEYLDRFTDEEKAAISVGLDGVNDSTENPF